MFFLRECVVVENISMFCKFCGGWHGRLNIFLLDITSYYCCYGCLKAWYWQQNKTLTGIVVFLNITRNEQEDLLNKP